jgi:anti-sigma B factor antagonist
VDARKNFQCQVLSEGGQPVVAFSGELDVAAADDAWAQLEPLINADTEGMVIDLSGVTFIDSRGLSVLVRAWTALGADSTVTLRGAVPRIRQTLEIAGVDRAFEIV